jgi:hypothetical protein
MCGTTPVLGTRQTSKAKCQASSGLHPASCIILAVCLVLLASCRFPGSVEPTVKIGLVAPFEGRYRDLGYEVLYAVRLAVRQRNATGGIAGSCLVELVALNDFDEAAEAAQQARELAADAGVLGVLGGWSKEAAQAAAPEYERLGLAFLRPGTDWTAAGSPPAEGADPSLVAGYQALSGGAPPGQAALWVYAQANRLLDAMDEASRSQGRPSREAVRSLLATNP